MGRQKYNMRGGLHGRNMLILEYIWIAYQKSLPEGVAPDEQMRRKRKQVSSHIQVLKNFYKYCKYCTIPQARVSPTPGSSTDGLTDHFLFGIDDNEKEKDKRRNKTDPVIDENPLKHSAVLKAIAAGQLPDKRPNYDYFAQLLTADAFVAIRPRTTWIFVSSSDVRLDETGTAFDRNNKRLDARLYPHLHKNQDPDEMPRRLRSETVLLHEYTKAIAQKEFSSGTVSEVAREWDVEFPALHDALERCTQTDEYDILEITATIELAATFPFPSGSQLNAFVELDVTLPFLYNHKWKCLTRLVRPKELRKDGDKELVEQTNEMTVQFAHRFGCAETEGCECMKRPKPQVRVPFPAAEWATILANCATVPKSSGQRRIRKGNKSSAKGEGDKKLTPSELLERVAMLQEVWSSPPDAHGQKPWTRRGVLVWRFQTTLSLDSDDKALRDPKTGSHITNPPGTSWRFLTAIDPTSQYHQERAYVHGNEFSEESLMSPGQADSHFSHATSHGFGNVWNGDSGHSFPPGFHAGASSLPFDPFASGLATPPPSGSLRSSLSTFDLSQSLDGAQSAMNLLPPNCNMSIDPFLAVTEGLSLSPNVLNEDCDPSLPSFGQKLEEIESWTVPAAAYDREMMSSHWKEQNIRAIDANRGTWPDSPADKRRDLVLNQWLWTNGITSSDGQRMTWIDEEPESPSKILGLTENLTRLRGARSVTGIKRGRSQSFDAESMEDTRLQ
jgi:transcriptional enhancer factor